MDTFWQHDESVDVERIFAARAGNRVAQRVDVIDKKRRSLLQQVDGEEPASARDEGAAIFRHDQNGIARGVSSARRGGLRLRLTRPTQCAADRAPSGVSAKAMPAL